MDAGISQQGGSNLDHRFPIRAATGGPAVLHILRKTMHFNMSPLHGDLHGHGRLVAGGTNIEDSTNPCGYAIAFRRLIVLRIIRAPPSPFC
jgi:hypothetical protein